MRNNDHDDENINSEAKTTTGLTSLSKLSLRYVPNYATKTSPVCVLDINCVIILANGVLGVLDGGNGC